MQPKNIDLTSGRFVANGKTYVIENTLSIDRYKKFEEMQLEVGYGRSFKDVFAVLRSAMDDLNKTKLVDASVKLYNLNYGVQDEAKKNPFVLRFCALFMNTENEDRASINDDQINQKINDWTVEGLNIEPFFQFATASLPGFRDAYKKLTATISDDQPAESQAANLPS